MILHTSEPFLHPAKHPPPSPPPFHPPPPAIHPPPPTPSPPAAFHAYSPPPIPLPLPSNISAMFLTDDSHAEAWPHSHQSTFKHGVSVAGRLRHPWVPHSFR